MMIPLDRTSRLLFCCISEAMSAPLVGDADGCVASPPPPPQRRLTVVTSDDPEIIPVHIRIISHLTEATLTGLNTNYD